MRGGGGPERARRGPVSAFCNVHCRMRAYRGCRGNDPSGANCDLFKNFLEIVGLMTRQAGGETGTDIAEESAGFAYGINSVLK